MESIGTLVEDTVGDTTLVEATIGDSSLVEAQTVYKMSEESVEFERNLDEFKKTLEVEEARLASLEAQRVKIQKEIEEMFQEVKEEKLKLRQSLDNAIDERERIFRKFLESCKSLNSIELTSTVSSMSLLNECNEAIDDSKKIDYTIDVDIEKIRYDLMENYIETKEDYLSTMKDRIKDKKKMLDAKKDEPEADQI